MAKKTTAQIEFKAVTSEFSAGIKQMNASITTLNNELKLNRAQLKGNENDVELLQQRQAILQKEYEASSQKVEMTSRSLEEAKRILGENSKEYQNLNNALLRAQTQQQSIQNEINQTNNRLDELAQASINAEDELSKLGNDSNSLDRLTSEIEQQKNELEELKQKYSNVALEQGQSSQEAQQLATRISSLSNDLRENQNRLNDVTQAANEFDNTLSDAAEESSRFGDVLSASLASDAITGALDKLTDVIGNIKDGLVDFALDGESAFNNLIAKTGATTTEFEGLEEIMDQIYADNFGESLEDVSDVMATIIQQTGASGDELLNMSKNAILLRDTFDFDVNESVRSANMLMTQFGLSSTEAYNLIAQGAQAGLDKNGDLLDTINEYSVHFNQAGYTAEEMFNSLQNGAAAGTFSVDKLGDAVKEFGIRMKDGSADEALKSIGLNVDDVTSRFAKGGETASIAMGDVVEALYSVNDPLKQNEAGVALFGTMWEDLGADGVNALMNIRGEADRSKDTLDKINEIKYDDFNSALEGIKRGFLDDLKPALDIVLTGIEGLMTAFSSLPQGVQTTIAVIGAVSVVVLTLVTAFGAVSACISAALPVFGALAGAIGAISAPVLIVVGVITALVAAGVALYQNWDTISQQASIIWSGITTSISNFIDGAKLKFTEFTTNISNIWNTICNVVQTGIMLIGSIISAGVQIITLPFQFIWQNCKEYVISFKNDVVQKINELKTDAVEKINSMINPIVEKFTSIKNKCVQAATELKTMALNKYEELKSQAISKINAMISPIVEKFTSIKNKCVQAATELKTMALNKYEELKSQAISKVTAMVNPITQKFTSIKNNITNAIDGAKQTVKSGLDKISGFFSNCKLSLPNIKLPHFSISGKLSINPPSVPKLSIKWYKKGGIMTSPTMFGLTGNTAHVGGEAGPEAILPLNNFYTYLDNKFQNFNSDGIINEIRRLGNIVSNLQLRLDIDGREFTRTAVAPNSDEIDEYKNLRNIKFTY